MSGALHELGVAAAARSIAARELSPVDLTEACLARIDALDPRLHAFITVTADLAIEQARAAEAEIVRRGPRGPLHGVPYALKDIYDTRGIRTTAHSALLADRVPDADAACHERLQAAGGVLLGKLATHEFATGGPAWDLPWPPAGNPWRLDRFPGGSSSGAAAAVAAGLAPYALGSDTGGSIRLPAGFSGLAGIKPTYGRVSKRGVLPLAWTLDTCGPLAWTVEDAALVLAAIAGHDPADPSTAALPVPDFCAALDRGVQGLRIGAVRHFYEADHRADDAAIAAMDASLDVLRDLGADVVDVTLPPVDDYQACYRAIMMSEAYAIHAADLAATPGRYAAVTRFRLLPGALIGAAQYANALRFQRVLARRTRDALAGLDVLVTATTYGAAPVQAAMAPEGTFVKPPLTNPFNIAQLPAISVCNGFTADGMPLGMQIAGAPFDEATVLRVAHAYERATPWRAARPPLDGEGADAPQPMARPGAGVDRADLDRWRSRAAQAGLHLDDASLADLAASMPHVERLLARIPGGRDYASVPATVFRHDD